MRSVINGLCLGCFFSFASVSFAEAPAETFSVNNYKLAFAEVAESGYVINEYVLRDENLEDWTSLIAVRVWPNQESLERVVIGYLQNISGFIVEEPAEYAVEGKSTDQEVSFELFLAPPDKSHLEYTLINFELDKNAKTITSYQLSFRGAYNVEQAKLFAAQLRDTRLDFISNVSLPVYSDTAIGSERTSTTADSTAMEDQEIEGEQGIDEEVYDEDGDDEDGDDEDGDDEEVVEDNDEQDVEVQAEDR